MLRSIFSRRRKPTAKANPLSTRLSFESLENRLNLTAGVTNLGATFDDVQLDGNLAAFLVSEFGQGGIDLNGDGDALDRVMHLYDASTGTTTNLALYGSGFQLDGNRLAFSVSELGQGGIDLNGDGDANDGVVHVFDASTGTITNLEMSGSALLLDGNVLAFSVSEAGQGGGIDLNGDGDVIDAVMHVYDFSTDTTTNLALDASGGQLDGNRLAFSVSESRQGNTDLNGDGDAADRVIHVYDVSTGTTTNLGLVFFGPQLDGNLLAFGVSEAGQGNTDLNGDGDALDSVMHVYDASTGTTTNLELDGAVGLQLDGNLLAFGVRESSQGVNDLNGDGDASDFVVHVFDATTGTTTNLELDLAGIDLQLDGNLLAFPVSEFDQGGADLNSDGDVLDSVMHIFDASAGTVTNLELGVRMFGNNNASLLDGNLLAFPVSEVAQGVGDLNSDGDGIDQVIYVFDASTGTTTNLALATFADTTAQVFQLDGNLLAFTVWEARQGFTDLNLDGDASDFVMHVYDANTGRTTNLALEATPEFELDGNLLAFSVSESRQGNTDLNGDSDTADEVVHVVDLSVALADPVVLITQLVADVQALNLENGIDNSLDAKVEVALNALDDVNENNNVAAISSLDAFIEAVEAQSGNKIDAEDADELVLQVQLIIDLLDDALESQV